MNKLPNLIAIIKLFVCGMSVSQRYLCIKIHIYIPKYYIKEISKSSYTNINAYDANACPAVNTIKKIFRAPKDFI